MSNSPTAASFLRSAATIYDHQAPHLAHLSRAAWRGGFTAGGQWMQQVLEHLRSQPLPPSRPSFQLLGLTKYFLAATPALTIALFSLCYRNPLGIPLAIAIFYAIEVQMLFLFPAALDGSPHPFSRSRQLLIQSGGTLRAMFIVLQLAAVMLFGGFAGRGFIRSWSLGCLAVCIWYESLQSQSATS